MDARTNKNRNSETIHLVTATNDNYAKHLAVMLNSLLENTIDTSKINIFIIDGDISHDNKLKLSSSVKKFNLDVQFLSVDDSIFSGFKERFHISKEAYYRIVIPNLLDTDIRKAIYLDCDTIVKKDIRKLWNINIDNYFLAAVEKATSSKARKKLLHIPNEFNFFNSGVLLLNLYQWRRNNISKKVLQFIDKNSDILKSMDQEALNAILFDKWLKLDPKWNYTTDHLKKSPKIKPAIIHFTRRNKPWNLGHPLQDEYFKYLNTTLWD
ncbi:glycosyltransferase family 8 protein [Paenibacillus sedimenti]|uniref:Glycosyltransferase family 8 protein n=1 Tax=Paenibacillus sedimenti TaxID=2770274 RepID=A0A926KQR7_9BACL|nr:glycosyltransferase family 8 protein [Paenibacillus sedimenti]MBD0381573.1 glycosyltransferase family 8 protein [Paenibacillus sedimenti]